MPRPTDLARTLRRRLAPLVLGLAALAPAPALAQGGPFRVDDSGITEPGRYKIEAFAGFSTQASRERQFTITPGTTLSLLPFVEFSLGISRSGDAREPDDSGKRLFWTTTLEPQAKIELLPLDRHGIGLALKGGLAWRASAQRPAAAEDDPSFRRTESVFGLGIVSVQPFEPLQLNLNLGAERDRIAGRTAPLWGIGANYAVLEQTRLIAEASGQDRGRAALQAGIRQTVLDGQVDLDLVVGRNLSDEKATWLILGTAVRF
jgi:hypothetical protein